MGIWGLIYKWLIREQEPFGVDLGKRKYFTHIFKGHILKLTKKQFDQIMIKGRRRIRTHPVRPQKVSIVCLKFALWFATKTATFEPLTTTATQTTKTTLIFQK